ncbi:hypothetical protein D9M68_885980 [compost metagenome]
MATHYRYTHSSSGNLDIVVTHDFAGLFNHFDLFFCITVFGKYINMRDHIHIDRVGIELLVICPGTLCQ